ncbi:MAG: RsmB/NOP family class I SAM-dependent RNA methyltransferase, partial [Sphingobacterium sp.]
VQDWSSQQSLDELQIVSGESWWDCCAASGGKSLLLLDRFPNIQLVVSDTRMSILRNLDERFSRARIHHRSYSKKILDLSQPVGHLMMGKEFDGILVDAPCSGSGTWGRTPESLSQFNKKAVSEFSILQQSIITNVVPYLRQGGSLLYITCSVFEQENENVARFVEEELGLKLVQQRSITGYTNRADTMFVAQFLKV